MSPSAASPVLLALGANLGSPLDQLREAVRRLAAVVSVHRVSSVYRTEPVGYAEQPDYWNLVLAGATSLDPRGLLRETQAIESALGRERSFPNAPRTLDIDLLDHAAAVVDTPELTLPHPRMQQRAFVLVPLVEIAPEWRHPLSGESAADLLRALPPGLRVERLGALDPSA